MARNRLVGESNVESAIAKEAGGAAGVPMPPSEIVQAPAALAGGPQKRARRYRIMNGGNIMYGNCRTAMRAGKEISDAQFDIDLLRRQGIRLEPLDEPDQPALQAASG